MDSYTAELEQFRKMKDDFFARDPHSPLTKAQKSLFKGLRYFPPNEALRFELDVEPFAVRSEVELQTSTGDVQAYLRHGVIRFAIEGQALQLVVFSNEHGFFLPFVDSLAGAETYPAGRYLEPQRGEEGRLHVDFNLAYNPYCAYNSRWSCPLTPFENRLKAPVRAGEMLPDPEWADHD